MLKLPTTPGGYGTILVDPPWKFDDVVRKAVPYATMTNDDILRLPVRFLRAPRSHLYLWTTDSHLEIALRAARLWGFEYKHPICWVKRGESKKLQIGAGHYYRKAHELCLFCVAGTLVTLEHSLPTVFEAPRTKHSAKPDRLYEMAEVMSPGPRLELFARTERPGWKPWGYDTKLEDDDAW